MSGFNRLAPWPYSMQIAGVGVMLKPDPQTGIELAGAKVQPFNQVAPQDYSYATTPPYLEQATPFRRVLMGFGEKVQQFKIVRRYFFADGVDASINGMLMLGPAFTTVTPANTGAIRGFVEATVAGTAKLLALASRYVLARNGDTGADWIVSKDLGAGEEGQSGARFKNNTAGGGAVTEAIYVALASGKLWQFTGATDTTTWTNITADLPAATPKAHYLELNNDLLIRSSDTMISTCAADPAVVGNWSGPVFVGDSSQPINFLRVLDGSLFIFKMDGVYDIDSTGKVNDLFPELRVTQSVTNGRNAAAWQQSLWFSFGDGFYQLGPNTSGVVEMHPVGPERFIENDSPVRGQVTASAGWSSWFNFLALYNSELNTSYILKLGAWFVDDQPPLGSSAYVRSSAIYNPLATGGSFYEPVLHGAIASFPGKKITALHVSTLPGPNERLYVGFLDGDVSWCILPRGTPNPLADSNCKFRTSGTIQFGSHTMNFPSNDKSFRGVTMLGPQVDPIDTVTVDWRVSPSKATTVGGLLPYTIGGLAAFSNIGALGSGDFQAVGEFTQSGQRIDFFQKDGTPGTSGAALDLRLTLAGDGSSTPFVEGFALHELLRPDLLLTYDAVVLAHDRITRRDGTADWRSADQIRQVIQGAADAKGVVAWTAPDGTVGTVEVIDYKEQLAAAAVRFGNAWDLPISFVEFLSTVQFGSIQRLSGYTIGDLGRETVGQLAGL